MCVKVFANVALKLDDCIPARTVVNTFFLLFGRKKNCQGVIRGFSEKCSSTCFPCVPTGVYLTDDSPSHLSLKDFQKYCH